MTASPAYLAALLTLFAAACAHRPGVSSDGLPLKRVVIYRNGVAYFERAGVVDRPRVEFQVKPDHVGDFLATLAVMEKGGSSVRSASFPIGLEEQSRPGPGTPPGPNPGPAPLKTVVLELDGKRHDLRVGYVSEQPVWKPSYRLVFEGGKPTLQAWGIVQNISGEDWKDVQMSLVAGAPIAFQSTLATPVTPRRPIITDSGEMFAAVPRGENTLAQQAPPPEAESLQSAPAAAPAPPSPMRKRAMRSEGRSATKDDMDEGVSEQMEQRQSSAPRNLALLATTQVQGGTTRYDLPQTVSVPNDSATMVLLLSRRVPGESVFMFAPDGGVPDSARHPFRVVRFTNDTPGLLERGPISVVEEGAFLGQGLLEPLAAGGEATVPFALERALAIDAERTSDEQASRLARIESGTLVIERDQVLRTKYRVRNGQATSARVVIRHPRNHGMRLHAAPKGTDDRVGMGSALVPVETRAGGTGEATVDERRAYTTQVDWMSEQAHDAVKGYLADPRANPKVASDLREAWGFREKLRETIEQRQKLEGERRIVRQATEETRQNLSSLRRNSGVRVDELRQKLAVRLAELDRRNAELAEKATELELRENELRVRFTDKVREIRIEQPRPPPVAS